MEEVKGQSTSDNNCDTGEDETSVTNLNEKIDCHTLDQLKQCGGYDESKLFQYLEELPEEVLSTLLKEINETNNILIMENNMYDFILKEDEIVQNALEMLEMDAESENAEDIYETLSYAAKCYFANKRLKALEKDLEQKRSISLIEIQNLEFQLESLNISLKALKEAQETFYKNVQFGGRHPVTKKVILQKVARYFDESIKNKMALTNRYKIQIKSDIMERNKLFSQIKEQEKRLASLDLMKFNEAKFQYEKSCKSLVQYKEQLAKCKSKHSFLVQSIAELKRSLEKEESEIQQIQATLNKKETMKNIMISEKIRNDQKVKELNAAMRRIRLDPRRHDLPEVSEYALIKRENENLKKNIKKWQKKVAIAEQAKMMYVSSLKKKQKKR
ncbi:uncharacterized protein TNIN_385021 [Trichonephila inaurata madagascariensis]|uniref:DUF4201 domain-containing protein n=1 Tax=Trichonephila inaurata madagascariensis TaxID=2747483 RepID=A0A8X7CIP9_9ARAC|nr:uncharacterized protein TNIN_385021 [Trichonephila inaurata madagascariensis]